MGKSFKLAVCAIALSAQHAANIVEWTDWTSAVTGPSGSASGIMGDVGVTYSGDVHFAQLGNGTDYWIEPNSTSAPYTGSSVVSTAPTPSEIIATAWGGVTNTLTFSAPVLNPVMAIVSLGQPRVGVAYDFDTPFTVISEGQGYWGDGSFIHSSGDALMGYEFHGVIQFAGSLSSISWTTNVYESWQGFTLGKVTPQNSDVSEPSPMLLLSFGLLGLNFLRKKKTI